ncbi:MAG TPA: Lrp/AsnC family transcriptional regulator [Desulfovibrio sp.]|jgi:DNA-binding Lrp family transcriptional regulator|uniref:siroheme decarboxylase subunit beta n=1 Tax=Desulfovibrio TaxID=872 RepID=UPI002A377EFB|nr:Lrp/AsnC family transcriptional regulator [Desulfovibrio sp.]MDY0306852.1 Lrp/AsnC family transcriptional regulator [Desulfovibrionaceae bacterium]HMM37631.1 Lrp/AsnC family transcriptional regulator [Desulfovibrio sp.]
MEKIVFTPLEERILALAGGDLPDSATPFADIAEAVGTDEKTVLDLLRGLKERGVIRRFGATLRHQKAGYGHNAMVAWRVDDPAEAARVGELLASRPEISHAYERRTYPEWPYNLYTMIHGRNPGDSLKVAEELSRATGITDYAVLNSLQELKKTSMRYFREEDEE